MFTDLSEENWNTIAEMIGVDIGVSFNVKIPSELEEYLSCTYNKYDFKEMEFTIFEDDGLVISKVVYKSDGYSGAIIGGDFGFIISVILGGILIGDIGVSQETHFR